MSKKVVIAVVLFLCGAFYLFYSLRQDLALVSQLTQNYSDLTVTLQNIETTRQSGKDLWRIKAESAVRSKGRDDLSQLTAESTDTMGNRKEMTAPSAVHYPDRNLVEISTPSGTWLREVGRLAWKADEVSWQQKEDLWEMRGNITVQDQRTDGTVMDLKAPSASFEGAGYLVIHQPHGTWKRSDDTFTLTAPESRWEQSKDQWTFPKGLKVHSALYSLTAESGQVEQGTFLSVKQGHLVWRNVQ